jgi:hypothetical protein
MLSGPQQQFEPKLGLMPAGLDITILERVRDHPLLSNVPRDVMDKVVTLCQKLIDSAKSRQPPEQVTREVRSQVSTLVTLISNINAISTIGTLEFTDSMAKYALNQTVCNVQPPKRGKEWPVRLVETKPTETRPTGSRGVTNQSIKQAEALTASTRPQTPRNKYYTPPQ